VGNKAIIQAGDVQRMSAGTGITHSEFNLAEKPVHFYQIWIYPDESGLEPTYDQQSYEPSEWKNTLLPVASGQNIQNVVTFHTDATIYRCDLEAGHTISFDHTKERRVFLYVTKGFLSVNGQHIGEADQARVDVEEPLILAAEQDAEFILIDVPSCKGWGYNDETLSGGKK
jgi:redox-sensitive bicupin YhaK (pirin superfamily)